jgi:hypothetical protein
MPFCTLNEFPFVVAARQLVDGLYEYCALTGELVPDEGNPKRLFATGYEEIDALLLDNLE